MIYPDKELTIRGSKISRESSKIVVGAYASVDVETSKSYIHFYSFDSAGSIRGDFSIKVWLEASVTCMHSVSIDSNQLLMVGTQDGAVSVFSLSFKLAQSGSFLGFNIYLAPSYPPKKIFVLFRERTNFIVGCLSVAGA